jgi:hypothetical protein
MLASSRLVASLGSLFVLLALADQAAGQCNPTCSAWKFAIGQGTEYYFDDNLPAEWREAFDRGANEWNNAHSSYGRAEMYLTPGSSGLRIVVETPGNPGAIAEWNGSDNTIRINPAYVNAFDTWRRWYVAMHELGHQMGFDDNYQCVGYTIMAALTPNSIPEFTTDDYCGFNYYYDPLCEAGGGEDYYNHCTPLVLSFTGTAPRLSEPAVPFDIAGDGNLPTCGWTRRSTDGLLALDRDGDGSINNGRELFGNVTPYSARSTGPRAWSGFTALQFFDTRNGGGNGNGRLDRGDAVFSRLLVWFDRNWNGLSEPGETQSLLALGIDHVHLNGLASNRTDRNGNVLWFVSSFVYELGGALRKGQVVDVILKVK